MDQIFFVLEGLSTSVYQVPASHHETADAESVVEQMLAVQRTFSLEVVRMDHIMAELVVRLAESTGNE